MRGAFGGTEGVVSETQLMETPADIVRDPDHPVTPTPLDRAAPTENETTTAGGVTIAVPAKPTDRGGLDTYIVFFLIFWVIIGFWCCYVRITPYLRTYPVRSRRGGTKRAHLSSTSDGDDVPVLSSPQAKAPAAAPRIQHSSSKSRRPPVVASRRTRPGRLNSPVVSAPPGDRLDLLYQDLA
ncbi:UNVERIFIED_CONTAM: hypothetical protein K2H54_048616 [Gekko kuhli]